MFPKQDTVEPGGFGNLVKLPLGVHAVSGKKSEIIPLQGWASSVIDVVPLPSSLVPEAPADRSLLRVPASGTQGGSSRVGSNGSHDGPASPFPCIDAIQYDGVGQGNRDNAMFHLALYFFGHGLAEDLAEEACLRANENFDPPLDEREVKAKVRTAYRGRYQSARCGTDWLRDICPGPCKAGWKVASAVEGELSTAQPGDVVEVEVVRRVSDGSRHRVTVSHMDASNQPTFLLGS